MPIFKIPIPIPLPPRLLLLLLITIANTLTIRNLEQQQHTYTSTTIKPHILQPIPTINIQVRNAKPSPIADLINQFRNILPNNNNHADENKKVNKPFYCSQRNTTSVPPFQNVSAREKLVATRYGFNMYVDSNDATVSNLIAISGTWEPEYIQLIGNIVKEGDNVINLGSQSGLEALVMGKIIGPTGRLFIFEPYSFSNQLITKNIELNNLTNITTIYKVGASDQVRNSSLVISFWNTGGSFILPDATLDKNKLGSDQVQIIQTNLVDSLLPADVQLNFALIDVEKMEVKALRGMRKIIDRSPNLVMMVQWQYGLNPNANQSQTVELLTWMIEKGYRIYTYMGGDNRKCKLGWFLQETNIQKILKIKFADLFFFPSSVPLPK